MRTHDTDERHDVDEAPSSAGHGRQRGFSLVEILVSISLFGVLITAILPAMWSTIRISRFSDTQAKVEAVLGSAVDRITNYGYVSCPETEQNGGYESKAQAASAIFRWEPDTVEIVDIKYWNAVNKVWTDTNPVPSGNCDSEVLGITKASTLQLVSIRVTAPDGSQSNEVDVVMGDIRTDEERDATPS
jgi:prepilin-type N-terminal cleavage/methylation domain-containing protein